MNLPFSTCQGQSFSQLRFSFWFVFVAPQTVPVSAKSECDKLRASIAMLRQELRKDHMPLQQTISQNDASPPFMKVCSSFLDFYRKSFKIGLVSNALLGNFEQWT